MVHWLVGTFNSDCVGEVVVLESGWVWIAGIVALEALFTVSRLLVSNHWAVAVSGLRA